MGILETEARLASLAILRLAQRLAEILGFQARLVSKETGGSLAR